MSPSNELADQFSKGVSFAFVEKEMDHPECCPAIAGYEPTC
jgi:hypothetical protein